MSCQSVSDRLTIFYQIRFWWVPSFGRLPLEAEDWQIQRAIAIQHQVYVLAPAQAGTHYHLSDAAPARTSWGESLAFDPWGRQLGRLQSVEDAEDGGTDAEGRFPSDFFTVDLDVGLVE